jgi:hypothetical protein
MLELTSVDSGIQWPVVFADGLDLMMFRNFGELTAKIEPVDVDSYLILDATGRTLRLASTPLGFQLFATDRQDLERLRSLLAKYLTALRQRIDADETTTQLLDRVARFPTR